jgi:hypothetical protein
MSAACVFAEFLFDQFPDASEGVDKMGILAAGRSKEKKTPVRTRSTNMLTASIGIDARPLMPK